MFCDTSPENKRNAPHLIADWLGRSGSLPLTLQISHEEEVESDEESDKENERGEYTFPSNQDNRWRSVINTLNLYSGRWCEADFRLPAHYIAALCGTSPPNSLCKLSFSNINDLELDDIFFELKMNTNPVP